MVNETNETAGVSREFDPSIDTPRNLDEMKIWVESLGIKEGSPTYATMMQEAIRTWNSSGLVELHKADEERRSRGLGPTEREV